MSGPSDTVQAGTASANSGNTALSATGPLSDASDSTMSRGAAGTPDEERMVVSASTETKRHPSQYMQAPLADDTAAVLCSAETRLRSTDDISRSSQPSLAAQSAACSSTSAPAAQDEGAAAVYADLLTCSMCRVVLEYGRHQAYLLPACLHTLCGCCAEKCSSATGAIDCKLCGAVNTRVVEHCLAQVLQRHQQQRRQQHSSTRLCGQCAERGARALAYSQCCQCDVELCSDCDQAHRRTKATWSHTINVIAAASENDRCANHMKVFDNYCDTCRALCCSECILSEHRSHQSCTLAVKAHHLTSVIRSRAQLLRSWKKEVHTARVSVQQQLEETAKRKVHCVDLITGHYQCFIEKVRSFFQKQRDHAEYCYLTISNQLASCLSETSTKERHLEHVSKFVSQLLQLDQPALLIKYHELLMPVLDRLENVTRSVPPMVIPQIEMRRVLGVDRIDDMMSLLLYNGDVCIQRNAKAQMASVFVKLSIDTITGLIRSGASNYETYVQNILDAVDKAPYVSPKVCDWLDELSLRLRSRCRSATCSRTQSSSNSVASRCHQSSGAPCGSNRLEYPAADGNRNQQVLISQPTRQVPLVAPSVTVPSAVDAAVYPSVRTTDSQSRSALVEDRLPPPTVCSSTSARAVPRVLPNPVSYHNQQIINTSLNSQTASSTGSNASRSIAVFPPVSCAPSCSGQSIGPVLPYHPQQSLPIIPPNSQFNPHLYRQQTSLQPLAPFPFAHNNTTYNTTMVPMHRERVPEHRGPPLVSVPTDVPSGSSRACHSIQANATSMNAISICNISSNESCLAKPMNPALPVTINPISNADFRSSTEVSNVISAVSNVVNDSENSSEFTWHNPHDCIPKNEANIDLPQKFRIRVGAKRMLEESELELAGVTLNNQVASTEKDASAEATSPADTPNAVVSNPVSCEHGESIPTTSSAHISGKVITAKATDSGCNLLEHLENVLATLDSSDDCSDVSLDAPLVEKPAAVEVTSGQEIDDVLLNQANENCERDSPSHSVDESNNTTIVNADCSIDDVTSNSKSRSSCAAVNNADSTQNRNIESHDESSTLEIADKTRFESNVSDQSLSQNMPCSVNPENPDVPAETPILSMPLLSSNDLENKIANVTSSDSNKLPEPYDNRKERFNNPHYSSVSTRVVNPPQVSKRKESTERRKSYDVDRSRLIDRPRRRWSSACDSASYNNTCNRLKVSNSIVPLNRKTSLSLMKKCKSAIKISHSKKPCSSSSVYKQTSAKSVGKIASTHSLQKSVLKNVRLARDSPSRVETPSIIVRNNDTAATAIPPSAVPQPRFQLNRPRFGQKMPTLLPCPGIGLPSPSFRQIHSRPPLKRGSVSASSHGGSKPLDKIILKKFSPKKVRKKSDKRKKKLIYKHVLSSSQMDTNSISLNKDNSTSVANEFSQILDSPGLDSIDIDSRNVESSSTVGLSISSDINAVEIEDSTYSRSKIDLCTAKVSSTVDDGSTLTDAVNIGSGGDLEDVNSSDGTSNVLIAHVDSPRLHASVADQNRDSSSSGSAIGRIENVGACRDASCVSDDSRVAGNLNTTNDCSSTVGVYPERPDTSKTNVSHSIPVSSKNGCDTVVSHSMTEEVSKTIINSSKSSVACDAISSACSDTNQNFVAEGAIHQSLIVSGVDSNVDNETNITSSEASRSSHQSHWSPVSESLSSSSEDEGCLIKRYSGSGTVKSEKRRLRISSSSDESKSGSPLLKRSTAVLSSENQFNDGLTCVDASESAPQSIFSPLHHVARLPAGGLKALKWDRVKDPLCIALDRDLLYQPPQRRSASPNLSYCVLCWDGGDIVLCDRCERAYHRTCYLAFIDENNSWQCLMCTKLSPGRDPELAANDDEMDSNEVLLAQRLLMELYSAYYPCLYVRSMENLSKIEEFNSLPSPITLDCIRERLNKKEFPSLMHFLKAVKVMLDQCQYMDRASAAHRYLRQLDQIFDDFVRENMSKYWFLMDDHH